MATLKQHVKADILSITYSIVAKQIVKISKNRSQANAKLFNLGEEIGLRIADQYQERETNSYKPEEVATVLLKGILRQYLGCDSEIENKQIKYSKGKFTITFKVVIKDNPLCDFIAIAPNSEDPLNYHSQMLGFVSGCMKSMCYNPNVQLAAREESMTNSILLGVRGDTVIEVDMWKEKEED